MTWCSAHSCLYKIVTGISNSGSAFTCCHIHAAPHNLYWQMKPQTGFIQNPEIPTEEQKLLNISEQRDDTMWLKTPRGQRFNLKLNKTSPTQHEIVRVSAPVQVRGQPTRFQPCCCPHYGSWYSGAVASRSSSCRFYIFLVLSNNFTCSRFHALQQFVPTLSINHVSFLMLISPLLFLS